MSQVIDKFWKEGVTGEGVDTQPSEMSLAIDKFWSERITGDNVETTLTDEDFRNFFSSDNRLSGAGVESGVSEESFLSCSKAFTGESVSSNISQEDLSASKQEALALMEQMKMTEQTSNNPVIQTVQKMKNFLTRG
jgi:hypothetical protein